MDIRTYRSNILTIKIETCKEKENGMVSKIWLKNELVMTRITFLNPQFYLVINYLFKHFGT